MGHWKRPNKYEFQNNHWSFPKNKKEKKKKEKRKTQLYWKQCPNNPTTAGQADCNYGRWNGQKGMLPFLSFAFFPQVKKVAIVVSLFWNW